jgi:hypothetical protein
MHSSEAIPERFWGGGYSPGKLDYLIPSGSSPEQRWPALLRHSCGFRSLENCPITHTKVRAKRATGCLGTTGLTKARTKRATDGLGTGLPGKNAIRRNIAFKRDHQAEHSTVRQNWCLDRSEGPAGESSDFLGDPPPDPRFLASLGALSGRALSLPCS